MVGEIEPKLAYLHNLTRKGRSSHGDDLLHNPRHSFFSFLPFQAASPSSCVSHCNVPLSLQARFAAPCFPGETLCVKIWKQALPLSDPPQQGQHPPREQTGIEFYIFEVSVRREKEEVAIVKNAAVEIGPAGWQLQSLADSSRKQAAASWSSRL